MLALIVGYLAVSFALIPVLDIIASRFDWSQTTARCIIISAGYGLLHDAGYRLVSRRTR
jgi:hypothetical protein